MTLLLKEAVGLSFHETGSELKILKVPIIDDHSLTHATGIILEHPWNKGIKGIYSCLQTEQLGYT